TGPGPRPTAPRAPDPARGLVVRPPHARPPRARRAALPPRPAVRAAVGRARRRAGGVPAVTPPRRHRAPRPAGARPGLRRRRARDRRLGVTEAGHLDSCPALACGRCLGGVPEWPIGTALKAVAGRDVSRGFESRPLCRWSMT